MATRKANPRMSPSLPSGKWVTIALATFAASAAVVVAVGYNAIIDDSNDNVSPAVNISTTANQERKLSPSGNQGFRDFDPDIVVPNISVAPAAKDLTPFHEFIADLSGEASAPSARNVSPTGVNGFRDFDPDLLYPNVEASISSERKLSPTGSQGFRDFDPEILYPDP